uniref:Uncharacterized protein n=1 Tax=Opuntia streptacantha TaxID=393608 RepID=A0A7C8ZW55_OPUST
MASLAISPSPLYILCLRFMLISLIVVSSIPHLSLGHEISTDGGGGGYGGRRRLLGFKETPAGTNSSFECSPSGPCVPCQYSEKNDDKYRCSETGYRIPFKCVKVGGVSEEASGKRPQNSRSTLEASSSNVDNSMVKHRALADKASSQEDGLQSYVTYRSCIRAVNEEKLSIIGFEVLMLGLLLVSGSFVFFRRKRTLAMASAGGVRLARF